MPVVLSNVAMNSGRLHLAPPSRHEYRSSVETKDPRVPTGRRSPTVFLLGAGFSRAISRQMPLIKELGMAVAKRFQHSSPLSALLDGYETDSIDNGLVPFGDVETWFTALAADQPFLSESQKLQRRSLFVELADQIAEEIMDRQFQASRDCRPEWLDKLINHWHRNKNDVITLNYDTLIESATREVIPRKGPGTFPEVDDILGSLPPTPPQTGVNLSNGPVSSFSLHKLHGSTAWFGRLDSSDLLSIVKFDALVPHWGKDVPRLGQGWAALKDTLSPVILPPLADKSVLYGNAIISAIWRRAHSALATASHIVIFGYSMPPTDTSIMALISNAVTLDPEVTIVDLCPSNVKKTIHTLRRERVDVVQPPTKDNSEEFLHLLERVNCRSTD